MASRQYLAEGIQFDDESPVDFQIEGIQLIGEFPEQFPIVKVQTPAGTIILSSVADEDAPSGMGGVLKIRKGGVDYALYLVETTDVHASTVRIKTSTGIKAFRLLT